MKVFLPFSDSNNKFKESGTKKENTNINICFLTLLGSFNMASILGTNVDIKINIKITK